MNVKGAGGTGGGIGQFFLGLALAGLGLYLFLDRVLVFSSLGTLFGFNAFGVALVPFVLGIAVLFFNSRSVIGWLLAGGSFLMLVVSLMANLTMFFAPTSLPMTLLMLGMIGAGLGLILRSFRDYEQKEEYQKQLGTSSAGAHRVTDREYEQER